MAKPDQLIKRRGKLGLVKVNVDFDEAKGWVAERMGKDISVRAGGGNRRPGGGEREREKAHTGVPLLMCGG